MSKSFVVNLNQLEDLSKFVSQVRGSVASDVNAVYENQIVDAKSVLGLVSLSSHPIKIEINSDDESEIEQLKGICEKFCVK